MIKNLANKKFLLLSSAFLTTGLASTSYFYSFKCKDKIDILVVGATGKLGGYITKHALNNPDLRVNILIRNPQKNEELCK